MYFYLLFIVFLYVGGCNARVVPLNFKVDTSKHVDSSGNELIDESPTDEVEILGHKLPDVGLSKDLELLNPEEDNATILEILNRNASNLPADLTPKEKATDEESNLESVESDLLEEISDRLQEKLNSTSEFIGQNSSESRDSFETIHVNGTLSDKTDDLTLKNEASMENNSSSPDLEQRNNLDLAKIEKELNDTLGQSETFEVMKSDQNETSGINNGTTSADFFELHPLTNDTKVEVLQSDAETIKEKFKSNNLTSENSELTNDSVKDAGGILSGFDFLINSEVARNAAKAMEVFNFSDPLTDHIMEENEFHSFLAVQDLGSPNQTDLKTTIVTNSSGESNEIRANLSASLSSDDGTSIKLNQTKLESTKEVSSMQLNSSKPLEQGSKTEIFDSKEKLEGNLTSEVSSPLKDSEKKNDTVSKKNITVSVSNSILAGVPECPPAGWCIFWFLSQDACAVNEHCHGNRICCKIGCSKTCIEIESLA